MATVRALLFDIGEVVSSEQWPLFDEIERITGRTLVGRGPLEPAGDPVWQRYLSGELSFTGYWAEYATANGYDDWRQLFRDLPYGEGGNEFVHAEAASLIRDAQHAGLKIGALTNDGVGIKGPSFFRSIPTLASFDTFADAQEFGGKPAPAAYLNAASELGVGPSEIIFLDDMPMCVDGARAVGMHAVLIDPMDRRTGFDEARRIAGLGDVGEAQRFVEHIDRVYGAGGGGTDPTDAIDHVVAAFDPDASINWNGRQVAVGADAIRRFHTDHLGLGDGRDRTVRTRLRSASYDTIAAEQELTITEPDGTAVRTRSGELWTLRRGAIIEWHHYGT